MKIESHEDNPYVTALAFGSAMALAAGAAFIFGFAVFVFARGLI